MHCVDYVIRRIPQLSGFRTTSLLFGCLGLVWGTVAGCFLLNNLLAIARLRSQYCDRQESDDEYGYWAEGYYCPEVPVPQMAAFAYVTSFTLLSALLLVTIILKRTNWIRVWLVAFLSWMIAFSIPVSFWLVMAIKGTVNRYYGLEDLMILAYCSASFITFLAFSIHWMAAVKGYYVEADQKKFQGNRQNCELYSKPHDKRNFEIVA